MSNDDSIEKIIKDEGGDRFHCDPADPGGATKFGITIPALTDHWDATGRRAKPSAIDIRDLTLADAFTYYRWSLQASGIGKIANEQLRYVVFDFAVHAGARQATRCLQRALGVKDDGVLGPVTIAACPAGNSLRASLYFCVEQMLFYDRLARNNLADADHDGIPDQLEYLPGYGERLGRKMRALV